MLIVRDTFPNFQYPDHNLDAPCPEYGWPNVAICAKNKKLYYPEHTGPLTIMCNFHGRAIYETKDERFTVNDSSYVLLNNGQRFTNIIQSDTDVESFHLNFRAGFAEEVLQAVITPSDKLLDEPEAKAIQPVLFFEKVYSHNALVTPFLMSLRSTLLHGISLMDKQSVEEQFRAILLALMKVHRIVRNEIEQLPALRRTTRMELYRRLHRAKNFIDDHISSDIYLGQMAREACLSPHHFLRMFKQAFGETPHQYLLRRRFDRARELLAATDCSITDIGMESGFTSLSYFSWHFARRFGASPEQFRFLHRTKKIAIS